MALLEEAKLVEAVTKENYLIKAFLCSDSGTGKTTSGAVSLPGKTLVIDYDGRNQALVGFEGIEVISCLEADPRSPKAWLKAEGIKKEIWAQVRKGVFPYDGVMEDGLSAMNRICMYWSLLLDPKRGLGGSPAKQHYGPHIKNLADHINSMLALPLHYVLTGHFNLVDDEETGAIKFLPKIFGKQARTDVPTWFDECYLCFHKQDEKTKKERFYWHTAGFGRYEFFKSTLNQLGKYWENPIEIDFDSPPIGFERLLEARFGKEKGGVKE